MFDQLAQSEQLKYDQVWGLEGYRRANHGLDLWNSQRLAFPKAKDIDSALDIGSGNGRLFQRWNDEGIDGWGIDISAQAIDHDNLYKDKYIHDCLWSWKPTRQWDIGICADVMEHIPEQHVDAVLQNIAESVGQVMFKIANFPDSFGKGSLHLTLQDDKWWREKLARHGKVSRLPLKTGQPEYLFYVNFHE